MFASIKKMFIGLLSSSGPFAGMANASKFATCISLNNQPRVAIPTLIYLNRDKWNQGLCYYPFMANLDKCNGSYNTLDDTSGRIWVPNKTEDIVSIVFKLTTGINKEIYRRKYNPNQIWNNNKCLCEHTNLTKPHVCEKNIFGILTHEIVKMVNIWKELLTIQ